jgi:hypothetical protein
MRAGGLVCRRGCFRDVQVRGDGCPQKKVFKGCTTVQVSRWGRVCHRRCSRGLHQSQESRCATRAFYGFALKVSGGWVCHRGEMGGEGGIQFRR